jgi:serine/threonine protein kinase
MASLAGTTLGAYEVKDLIGRGGMAAVYRAHHSATGRDVAIKVMLPDLGIDDNFRKRFDREARTLAGIQHVHILPVFDYGDQDSILYLVMPLLPGKNLGDKLRAGRMDMTEVARLFRQMASALDYAHQRGFLHRDIKPGNVLLDDSGNALLADFGLTRMIDNNEMSRLTSDSTVVGTPAYMSPEQGQGMELDARSDLYSLGVVLYEMLTGDVPFRAETPVAVIFKHVSDPIPTVKLHRDDLPDAVENVLKKALAKFPNQRFTSALAMAEALDSALGLPTTTASVSAVPTTPIFHEDPPTTIGSVTKPSPTSDYPTVALPTVQSPRRMQRSTQASLAILGVVMVLMVTLVFVVRPIAAPENNGYVAPIIPTETTGLPLVLDIDAEAGVTSLAFSPDGTRIVAGRDDNTAAVYEVSDGDVVYVLESHSGDVLSVAYTADGGSVFTGGADNMYFQWETEAGSQQITGMEGGPVRAFATGQTFYAYATNQYLSVNTLPNPGGYFYEPIPTETNIFSLAFAPTDGLLAVGDADGNVLLFNPIDRDFVSTFKAGAARISGVTFNADASQVFAGDNARIVHVWNVADGEIRHEVTTAAPINGIAITPDSSLLATAHEDNAVRLWEADSMALKLTLTDFAAPMNAVRFNPNGNYLVTAGDDGRIRIWDIADLLPNG